MALALPTIPGSMAPNWTSNVKRPTASYHPSLWADHFQSHASETKFEQQREHVASAIQCYMKQHRVSEEEVVKVFREKFANAWKDINEECLRPTAIPMCLLERVLNLARVIDLLYKDGDSYTNSYKVKDLVASLLKDPVT